MATTNSQAKPPLVLVCGDDEFAVKRRARELFQEWCAALGGLDHEQIDGSAATSGEALKALARLRDALQSLPFFGTGKAVWFQNCNFLGDERAASAAVTEELNALGRELQAFRWDNVRLVISAGKVDRRKTFFKTLERAGTVEILAGLSAEDKDWSDRAGVFARQELRNRNRQIGELALNELVTAVGPNLRQLANEIEKLSLYAGARLEIAAEDVAAVVSRGKHARAFGLAEALGDRDLPRALRRLDEELWEMKFASDKSAIGLLYSLIAKLRVLLMLKELLRLGQVQATHDYSRFKAHLERLPAASFPEDRRYNPLSMHPYTLFKAIPQTNRYSTAELVQAIALLLTCNQRLVSSALDEGLVLQRALATIIGPGGHGQARSR